MVECVHSGWWDRICDGMDFCLIPQDVWEGHVVVEKVDELLI